MDKDKTNNISTKPDQWEINIIGHFLLTLQQQQELSVRNEFYISKELVRKRFNELTAEKGNILAEFIKKTNGKSDIGYLLYRTNFLLNTPRGSDLFRIKSLALHDFRQKVLNEHDTKRKSSNEAELMAILDADDKENKENIIQIGNCNVPSAGNLLPNKGMFEVDEYEPVQKLVYNGTGIQRIDDDFQMTGWCCCICQKSFTPGQFELHVGEHGIDSDFKLLSELRKRVTPFFQLSYQPCQKSHYFRFTLEWIESSELRDEVTLDRIILVQSRSFYYVHKTVLPKKLNENGTYWFYMDAHNFRIHVEQPIVLVFRQGIESRYQCVEQHHFLRSLQFPNVAFAVNPNRLPRTKYFATKFMLPQYYPSIEIRKVLQLNKSIDDDCKNLMDISNEFKEYYCNGMQYTNIRNYEEVMRLLLYVEDFDTSINYQQLTLRHESLVQNEKYITVKVNLTDGCNFESILSQWDEVMFVPEENKLTEDASTSKLMFKTRDEFGGKKIVFGQVERVSNTGKVTISCDKKINSAQLYAVIFRPQRMNLRYQYRSLDLLSSVSSNVVNRFIFPKCDRTLELPKLNLQLKNETISTNPEQLQTVYNIVSGSNLDVPYIIFGPPGTGKTTTLVETIWQLYKLNADAKILVTANSNSACDEIAKRLCQALKDCNDPRAIIRVYARSMTERVDTIDELLLDHSNLYDSHFYPDVEILHEYRVCVCTFSVVGKLCTGKFGRPKIFAEDKSHFTHLIVDECAASTEPETLTGIIGVLSSTSRLILAGDDRQLGPVLKSKRAENWGVGISMMERLLKFDCYRVEERGNYDRGIQTRLIRNYRSHPSIVNLYSNLFYNNEVISCTICDVFELARNWCLLPNPNFPIIFHAVYGGVMRENSTSLFNIREMEVVMSYVKDLLYFGINVEGPNGRRLSITQSDIGIISPYKKQYQRIQEELNLRRWYDIETGSVETFQGKEKAVIIVSFVRSFLPTIGFLDNPRRLNVTISRAKSLMILVGNPKTLSLQPDFENIIRKCQLNNTYVEGKQVDDIILQRSRGMISGYNNRNDDAMMNKIKNHDKTTNAKPSTNIKMKNTTPMKKKLQPINSQVFENRKQLVEGMVSDLSSIVVVKDKKEKNIGQNKENQNKNTKPLDELFKSLPRLTNQNFLQNADEDCATEGEMNRQSPYDESVLIERLTRLDLRNTKSIIHPATKTRMETLWPTTITAPSSVTVRKSDKLTKEATISKPMVQNPLGSEMIKNPNHLSGSPNEIKTETSDHVFEHKPQSIGNSYQEVLYSRPDRSAEVDQWQDLINQERIRFVSFDNSDIRSRQSKSKKSRKLCIIA